jgi:radical SAM protein with 4Fe4S-binding SPASM domain
MNIIRYLTPLLFKHRLTELTYFVTSSCNFKCRHCFVIDQLNKKHQELTPEELKKMGRSIPAMQRVHIGGGEPFTRSDIAETVITIAREWNVGVMCLPTNGWFTSRTVDLAKKYGSSGVKCALRMHFSLSTLPSDMDSFTGQQGSYSRWRQTIDQVKQATSSFKNISVLVLSTFNDFNQDQFPELMHIVLDEIGVDDFSFCLVREHKNYQPNLDIAKFNKLMHLYYGRNSHQHPLLKIYRESIREVIADYYKNPREIVPCCAGRLRVVMSPDGDVYPCETLGYPTCDDSLSWRMGNIRDFDYNIKKLLASDTARNVRNEIRKRHCHCEQGIDISLSLLCSNRFRFVILERYIKYLLRSLLGNKLEA